MRTLDRLKEINEHLERRLNHNYPGLGAVILLFDSKRPGQESADRPISVMLHGIREEDALRLLQKVTFLVDQSAHEGLELPTGPLIIKPH